MNTLAFSLNEPTGTFSFFKEKTRGSAPLQNHEFPTKWRARHTRSAEELDQLYTHFGPAGEEGADFDIEVNYNDAPRFTSHYLHKQIHRAFAGTADLRMTDFINRVHLWFRYPSHDEFGYNAYKRFVLSTRRYWFTEGWGVTVKYSGHSWIYPKALLDEDFDLETDQVTSVAYNSFVFSYQDIPEEKLPEISFDKVFPVVNLEIRQKHGAFNPPDVYANKVKRYYDEIEWFRSEFLDGSNQVLNDILSLDSTSWTPLPDDSVYRIPQSAGKMKFGGGNHKLNPFDGMSRHGPYQTSPHRNIRIIFIAHKEDRKGACSEFYSYLKGKKTFSYVKKRTGEEVTKPVYSLPRFINLPADLTKKTVLFSDEENPIPEIVEGVDKIRRETGDEITLFAYYITRIESEERDPEKRKIYYRLKEELLRRSISSQVVEKSTILRKDFRYSLPNIYTATLAKLGGIPWILEKPPAPELLVGIGAFKPRELDERYLGSAICFDNDGTFHGMRCFAEDEPHMLAGSVREAVTQYLDKHGDAERLIIHFYKRMSRKEWKPIMDTLQSLGLDIPVIVLTISKTEFEDTVLFDLNSRNRLPLSGTWFARGSNDFLLCNNTLYSVNSTIRKGFPFPVRIRAWCSDEELLNNYDEREKLMRQVYQFSRLYWKSVSQQPLPVTVKYPEMVAEMFPWFESLTLPSFGRKNLWFL